MRTISDKGLNLLIELERERLEAYDDARPNVKLAPGDKVLGTLTIGVGHTGSDVYIGQKISKEESRQILLTDLQKYEDAVYNSVRVPLNDNQFDALVIFTFNVGIESFKNSTLLQLLNLGKYQEVPTQLARWNKTTINGKTVVSQGLTNRRAKEIALWNTLVIQTQPQPTKWWNKLLGWFTQTN